MLLKKLLGLLMFLMSLGLFAQEFGNTIRLDGVTQYSKGDKCYILQYRAYVRAEPSKNSNVISILSLNNQIEILENSGIVEVINGIHGTWLKIKYGNIVGYTFSGNLAMRVLATDIDNNGITDYFYLRQSFFNEDDYYFGRGYLFDCENIYNDIFIYINNQRINTNKINIRSDSFSVIQFEEDDNCVFINLFSYDKCGFSKFIYKVRNDGLIEYMESESD